jgi:predicted AAA+ superfamily ATPase
MALIPRLATNEVLDALRTSRAVGLLGPRQAGKSTLARDLVRGRWKADYLTLDDQVTRAAASNDPSGFVATIDRPTVIDEVQRVPELLLAIKARLDRNDERGQFLLTGSANLLRARSVHDALPGRVDYVFLWSLSQAEIERGSSGLLDELFDGVVPRVRSERIGPAAYAERVAAGGYPDAFRRPARSRLRFFESYVGSVGEAGIRDLASVRRTDVPGRLLRLVASRSAGLLNTASLGRDLGIDQKTAAMHLLLLEELMLVRRSLPWHGNLGSRQIKSAKVYVTDTGLLCGLIGADAGRIARDPAVAGMVFETFVVMELVKLEIASQMPIETYHYRDRREREVDILLERPDGDVVAVEVKSGASVGRNDLRSLEYLRDRAGARFKLGVVMYTGERSLRLGDRLAAVPIQALWTV